MPSALRRRFIIILFDLCIALFAFWFARYFVSLPRWYYLILSAIIWVILGTISRKLQFGSYMKIKYALLGIGVLNVFSGMLLYFFFLQFVPGYKYDYSILLAMGIITVLEWCLYIALRKLMYQQIPYFYEEPLWEGITEVGLNNKSDLTGETKHKDIDLLLRIIKEKKNPEEVIQWIAGHPDLFAGDTILIDSSDPESVLAHRIKFPSLIVHIGSLNKIRRLNTFLSYSNYCLDRGKYIFCHCTTAGIQREKIMKQNPPGVNYILCFLDYCWHRIFSKLFFTKDFYFFVTKGKKQVFTRVEVLGRLYRAGFEVIHEEISNGEFYVIASKKKAPIRNDIPSTGLLIRLRRIGKDGKIIGVYKLRTMFAYSEYLQNYVLNHSKLIKGDKISNDYRVNSIGRYFRMFWIDEIPQLINLLKGDIKLIGVRPLSDSKFSLYTKELQKLRVKIKPGLIPPYYYDLPDSLEEMETSEMRYINAYLKNPFLTDWRYFWRAFWNIVVKRKRSR